MNTKRVHHILTTIVFLILGTIVLVWPFVTGLVLKRDFKSVLENLSAPNHISIHEVEFKRGWFNSEARSILTLEGKFEKQVQATDNSTDQGIPFQLTLFHRIQHGPVLGIGRPSLLPAAALIETTVEFPPNTQAWLQSLFNQEPSIRLRTLVRLNGETITRIESPTAQGKFQDGATINWQGLGGTLEICDIKNMLHGAFTVPLLDLSNNAGQLRIEQLDVKIDYRHHPVGLWLGDIHLDLKTLAFMISGKSEQRFSITDFSASSASREEMKTLTALISMDLDDLSIGGRPLGSGGLTVDLRGVDLLAFSTMYHKIKYLKPSPEVDRSQVEEKVKQIIVTQLPSLMSYSPEVGISRLDLKTLQGPIQGKFQMSLSGGNENSRNITLSEISKRLKVEAELSAPLVFVTELFQSWVINEIIATGEKSGETLDREQIINIARNTTEQYFSSLVANGLLMRLNDRYSAKIKFENGQMNINGRSRNELFEALDR